MIELFAVALGTLGGWLVFWFILKPLIDQHFDIK